MDISKLNKSALSQLKDAVESPSLRLAREAVDSPSLRLLRESIDSPLTRLARESIDDPLSRIAREAIQRDDTFARIAQETARQTRLFDPVTLSAFEQSRKMFADIQKQSAASLSFSKVIEEMSAASRYISEQMRATFAGFDRIQFPKIPDFSVPKLPEFSIPKLPEFSVPKLPDFRLAATQELAEQFRSQQDSLAKMFARDDIAHQAMNTLAEQVARSFATRDMDLAHALRESIENIRPQLDAAEPFETNTAVLSDSIDVTDSFVARVDRAGIRRFKVNSVNTPIHEVDARCLLSARTCGALWRV